MAGNKHATAFSLENASTAAFATGRKPSNPLELLTKTLGEATARPDIRPSEQARGGAAALVVDRNVEPTRQLSEGPASHLEPGPATHQAQPLQAPAEARQNTGRNIEDDGSSFRVSPAESDEVNRGGRPRHGAERKVERTISMDKSLDKILLNLAIIESVRLGRRVSSAEVAVHLMQYGLSNMKDNQILPGDDGLGLQLATAAPTSVALPKIGGNVQ